MTKSDMAAAFDRVLAQLKARLGNEVFSSWFGRLKLEEASKSIVRMSVPTPFLRAWISNHYSDLINELWLEELPGLLKMELVVRTAQRAHTEAPATAVEASKPAPAPSASPHRPTSIPSACTPRCSNRYTARRQTFMAVASPTRSAKSGARR